MDQHPIPQDVTGFQFKLIGNMTLKQFGYVAAGVISAVILYYLPLQGAFGVIIKILFIPIFGGSGIAIAFLPIEGRPVDVMAGNLVKAIFSPNQYVYHKIGRTFSFTEITTTRAQQSATTTQSTAAKKTPVELSKEKQLQAFLQTSSAPKNQMDEKESAFIKTLAAMSPAPAATTIPTAPVAPKLPTAPAATQETADALKKQEAVVAQQLEQAKKDDLAQTTSNPLSPAHQKVALLEKQMQFIHNQKQQVERELAQLKVQLALQQSAPAVPTPPPATNPVAQPKTATPANPTPAPVPSVAQNNGQTPAPAVQPAATTATQPATPPPAAPAQQLVRSIPTDMTKKMGLPHVPDTPNVVVGIVKDSRGNVIPNVLVEVKDKDGNPVRAFKTNLLGQFASATPLSAGSYTIELEDPKKQHTFDVIQITPNNQIMAPIEVTSHDEREALRKALFN